MRLYLNLGWNTLAFSMPAIEYKNEQTKIRLLVFHAF